MSFTLVRGNSDYLYSAPQLVSPGVYQDNPNSPEQNFNTQVRRSSCTAAPPLAPCASTMSQ